MTNILQIGKDSISDLTDEAPDLSQARVFETLHRAIVHTHGAVCYSNLRARKMGPLVALSFELHVIPSLTVVEAQHVEEKVTEYIVKHNEAVTEISIHITPANLFG